MFKKVIVSFFISVFALTMSVPNAQAVSLNEALQRMDAILAQMEALRAEFAILSSSVQTQTPAVLGSQSTPVLTQSLEYGDTNSDIEKVQKLLATDPSIYPYGVASGFFGPKTQEAIRNFQARFGLDTVGVIGPATKSLLELFLAAYPSGNYPANVLQAKPQVQGESISNPAPTVPVGTNPAKEINVTFDYGEALIEIVYTNGNRKGLIAPTDDESEVVSFIASRTTLTQAQVLAVIEYDEVDSSSSSDVDEDDAEDALDDAEDAIEDAEDAIEEADDDGDDVDWAEDTLEEAEDLFEEAEEAFDDEDYEEAYELAQEAEEMAETAEDRIDKEEDDEKGDSDEIEEIIADVDDGETEITVEYEDGDEYEFTVEEDDEDNIIEEVADELDMDEDDVEDLIEFDYGKIDRITVRLDDDESLVRIFYTSGVERRLHIDSDDEDEIIEEIADELDEDEDDIEDLTEFD